MCKSSLYLIKFLQGDGGSLTNLSIPFTFDPLVGSGISVPLSPKATPIGPGSAWKQFFDFGHNKNGKQNFMNIFFQALMIFIISYLHFGQPS